MPSDAPVLFLDIDGVLNSAAWMEHGTMHGHNLGAIDPAACALLDTVLVATGAVIVLSSSWRIVVDPPKMQTFLHVRGCPSAQVIDRTGGYSGPRGSQIQRWLDGHPDRKRFAILDDSSDMEQLLPRLIQTSWARGLEAEHLGPLTEMLLREPE